MLKELHSKPGQAASSWLKQQQQFYDFFLQSGQSSYPSLSGWRAITVSLMWLSPVGGWCLQAAVGVQSHNGWSHVSAEVQFGACDRSQRCFQQCPQYHKSHIGAQQPCKLKPLIQSSQHSLLSWGIFLCGSLGIWAQLGKTGKFWASSLGRRAPALKSSPYHTGSPTCCSACCSTNRFSCLALHNIPQWKQSVWIPMALSCVAALLFCLGFSFLPFCCSALEFCSGFTYLLKGCQKSVHWVAQSFFISLLVHGMIDPDRLDASQ